MSAEESQEAVRVEREDGPEGTATLRLSGPLTFAHADSFLAQARRHLARPARAWVFDLAGVTRSDTATLALLARFQRETRAEVAGASGRTADLLQLYRGPPPRDPLRKPPGPRGLLDQVGRMTIALALELQGVLAYLGAGALALVAAVRRPRSVHWPDVPRLMERAGADGFPIVFLISFLIGLIMAFQSAMQLKQFGADIFVANLVGLSITRELGPLMTAIVVAGRSGAAFAAELGTMKVSEEIDALRTLGLCPYRFLVFPRLLALAAVLPVLTLLADAIGITGGLITSVSVLDLTPRAYLLQTAAALSPWDVFSGVVKSVVFAAAISLIACERGLATSGGAEGVGRSTTSAVVTILFHLVALDAAFTVLFHAFGV